MITNGMIEISHTYPCCACCDENPHMFEANTHTIACRLCQTDPVAARAWDEGADFVACNPGMSAEYVRDANPTRAGINREHPT